MPWGPANKKKNIQSSRSIFTKGSSTPTFLWTFSQQCSQERCTKTETADPASCARTGIVARLHWSRYTTLVPLNGTVQYRFLKSRQFYWCIDGVAPNCGLVVIYLPKHCVCVYPALSLRYQNGSKRNPDITPSRFIDIAFFQMYTVNIIRTYQ